MINISEIKYDLGLTSVYKNDIFIGMIHNTLELIMLQIKVMDLEEEGYYVKHEDIIYPIDKKGRMKNLHPWDKDYQEYLIEFVKF